jgi:hypothetical protein
MLGGSAKKAVNGKKHERRRELRWGAVCAVGLELLSQASDALFLWTALRPLADPLLYRVPLDSLLTFTTCRRLGVGDFDFSSIIQSSSKYA